MKARVAVLAGDGIGPEVIAEGLRCLHAIAELFGHEFELTPLPFGGAAIDSHADPLPERTLSACLAAAAVCSYTAAEIERITRVAGRLAQSRRRRLTSIDKANVLETSRLWREVCTRVVAREFPDLTLDHVLVDAAAMHLIRAPRDFDVLLTENLFGDILTAEAALPPGSPGEAGGAVISRLRRPGWGWAAARGRRRGRAPAADPRAGLRAPRSRPTGG